MVCFSFALHLRGSSQRQHLYSGAFVLNSNATVGMLAIFAHITAASPSARITLAPYTSHTQLLSSRESAALEMISSPVVILACASD
jgi:hypothetical protein